MRRIHLLTLALASLTATVSAQRNTGLELELNGATNATYGEPLSFSGVVYDVIDLAELRPAAGAQVFLRLREYDAEARNHRVVRQVEIQADRTGRFAGSIVIPEQRFQNPQLQFEIRSGQKTRTFEYGMSLQSPLHLDVLLDRRRYEPGETANVWVRLTRQSDGAPVTGRTLRVVVNDPSGRPLADQRLPVAPSGAITMPVELPASAVDGGYSVRVSVDDSIANASGAANFQVGRRTVERILVDANLDRRVVPPSGQLTGLIRVNTPSGTPIAEAEVKLSIGRVEQTLTTNSRGEVPIRMDAPSYLAGDVATQAVQIRVTHPGHGTIHTQVAFLLSRVQWRVEATAETGGLVPEVDAEAILAVTDPRGEPAPAGTRIRVVGATVPRGTIELAVDAHGLAVVPLRVEDGAAGPIRGASATSGCSGIATRLDVTVLDEDRPAFARVCVAVQPKARVRPEVRTRVVAPGGTVEVDLGRHPDVRGRPVLVEALSRGVVVASDFATGARASLELPPHVSGVVQLRARPLLPHDRIPELDQYGGTSLGVGSFDAVLVRPADAFGFALEPDAERYEVRQTAQVSLATTSASPRAWAALVVRDLAMHGGEVPWTMDWLRGAIDEAATNPAAEGAELMLRAALTATLPRDGDPSGPQPLTQPYWRETQHFGGQTGVLRDPIVLRDELRRRGIGRLMVMLESIVESATIDDLVEQNIVSRRGAAYSFHPDALANLVNARRISASQVATLGNETMTIANLREVDPTFSFATLAQRITRKRLVFLMLVIKRFTDPDNADAARASAGQPPERWLSRLVQLGTLTSAHLLDPWGRPFSLRRTTSPRVVLSDRAPAWELVSPGPDGRAGTGDDVSNPFGRVVAAGSPYAVASGEDRLMKALSTLAPGPQVLAAMAQAYASISLAARDEQRARTVTASLSEADDALGSLDGDAIGEAYGYGGLGLRGTGRGGGGSGEGTIGLGNMGMIGRGAAPSRARSRAPQAAAADMAEPEEAIATEHREQRNEQQAAPPAPPSAFGTMRDVVREDFPATLAFVGEIPLDGTATTHPVVLADALTTYRVEAIAWTATGWVRSASTELRVDQEATIDAPIPPFATIGDVLTVPVRVENRTDGVLHAKVTFTGEGLGIQGPEAQTVEVPAHRAIEVPVELRTNEVGEGSVMVRVLRASDDAPLDAVRRPLVVWPDARLVRDRRSQLIEPGEGTTRLRFEVPADATARGAGELRIVPATALFGAASEYGAGNPHAGWALALLGEEIPEEMLMHARAVLRVTDLNEAHNIGGNPIQTARAIATAWNDATVPDGVIRRGLRHVSGILGGEASAGTAPRDASALLALAVATRHREQRAALRDTVDIMKSDLIRRVGSGAVQMSDAPVEWARAAFALALAGESGRARELLRRVERHVITLGSGPDGEAFLEAPNQAGQPWARLEPTALVAGAWAALSEPGRGLPFTRHLVGLAETAEHWPADARVYATASAGLLAGRGAGAQMRATIDGRPLELAAPDDAPTSTVRVAVLPDAGTPGAHVVEIAGAPGLALAFADVRYGRPWDSEPARRARIDLVIDGELGPRDARAGLALTVRNREPRLMTAPIVWIDLPAGTELDEPTREALHGLTVSEPTMEGRTLQLRLRPLAPGGHARIPLPLRWSLSGTLRGLGASAFDDASAAGTEVRATAVLGSRELVIDREGEEPDAVEAESSPAPLPPPPLPIEPLDSFGPVASATVLSTEVLS